MYFFSTISMTEAAQFSLCSTDQNKIIDYQQ